MPNTTHQLLRYAIVGILTNATGYGTYLFITWLGVEPKATMSAIYLFAASLGYFGHRQWSFSHQGSIVKSAYKYGLVHFSGYFINFVLLYVFVDLYHYPHQLIQACAVVVVAAYLFIMFRCFVFSNKKTKYFSL